MKIPFRQAPEAAAAVLEKLVSGLDEPGASRVIDNTAGTFMPVSVSFLVASRHGSIYSVAHRFEAQGDLVADPDMELLCDDSGWYPLSITMAFGRREAVALGENGGIRVDKHEYADQLRFLSSWMRNIAEQQGL